jgi:SNF2 family DNA or RNA helicase
VELFLAREKASENKMSPASPQVLTELLGSGKGVPDFQNGRELRDYQVESFKWMVQHALTNSSCILGDEMGLGKTAQVCPVHPLQRLAPHGALFHVTDSYRH